MKPTTSPVTAQEQERIHSLMSIIPSGGRSILDVGARDGHISQLLTSRFETVTALDLETPAVTHEQVVTVKGDVTQLDIGDNSFDVVLCAEVLEHLPAGRLAQACREISRVAAEYVVIGVPYRQDLRVGRTTCRACGRQNPPWGHVNTFDEGQLKRLFHPLPLARLAWVGESREMTNAVSAWLVDVAGNPWGTYDQAEPCIFCGQSVGPTAGHSVWQKLCAKAALSLDQLQQQLVSPQPNWVHAVFAKQPRRHGPAPLMALTREEATR